MGRPAQLVSQHLEHVSRKLIERYEHLLREHVRGRHGVYALYKGDRLYYVGLASNLRSRLGHHLRDRHNRSWDHFSIYLTTNSNQLRELESLFLRIFRPRGNRQAGRFARSQDLKRELARQYANHSREEAERLFGRPRRMPARRNGRRSAQQARITRTGRTISVSKALSLKAQNAGVTYRARLRTDGQVRFKGKLYSSLSSAARAALGRGCSGPWFWMYERAPGDWVRLVEMGR